MIKFRIKEICKEKKIKMEDLANSVELSLNSMSCIVNGKQTPRLETLEKIANALEVDITDLFESSKIKITCPHCKKTISLEVSGL